MKKIISTLIVTVFFTLSGCSFIEEANNSLDYVNETTEYINDLSTFAEDTSSLVNEAANNPEVKAELETKLKSLKETIKEYNKVEAPSLAKDLHQSIKDKNKELLAITNNVLQNGEVAINKLKESEIYQTIDNITTLKDQIEQLGL